VFFEAASVRDSGPVIEIADRYRWRVVRRG
jgi:hypothetical protein